MPRILLLILLALFATPAAAQLGGSPNLTPRLVVEGPVRPGGTVDLAIAFTPRPGWHGYWSNPGDAGQAMQVDWTLPPGVTVAPLRYPVPQRLVVADLMNYVFEGPHAILTRLAVPATATGTLPIRAKAQWLACTDRICVPERGELALDVAIGSGPPVERARFDDWRRALPRPLVTPAHFAIQGDRLRLAIPLPASVSVADAYVFPSTENAIDYAGKQTFRRSGDTLIADLPRRGDAPTKFAGLLALGDGSGLQLDAVPGPVPSGGALLGGDSTATAALWALLGALAGGLLLNLMPCVFPILALKAMALARAGGDERHARRDAIGYTFGAVVGTGGLGVLLLALRAGGAAAGWGFQLSDPRTVFVLFLLAVAITLNLVGLVSLPVIGSEANPRGGFATGLLAAFVATPCAGPFLGAALGTALILPPVIGFGIFVALGVGLALPFLAIAFIPALRARLPRPGAWMRTFQRVLAVPMALTALACLWLLWRLGGTSAALAAGISGVLLIAALTMIAVNQRRDRPALGIPVMITLVAAVLPLTAIGRGELAVVGSAPAGSMPWSEQAVADLTRQGRPVFVDFTADWCLTCKANEAAAIDRPAVKQAFADANVAILVADWTRGDPAITRFLESRGRAGVPLYLWYVPGKAEPEELPQLLTPGLLTAKASGRF